MIVMIDSDRSTMVHNGTRNRTTAATTATPSKRSNSTTDIANYYKNN